MLVGPWTGALCISVVLLVQALFMADGGITALGTNITLMAVVGLGAGWMVFRPARAVLPDADLDDRARRRLGALVSVPVAAAPSRCCSWSEGRHRSTTSTVLTAMVGWHTVIGVGEAVVTGLVVGAVVASRPDLVHGARGLRRGTMSSRSGRRPE